jgi:alanine dehydrogenase
LANKGARQALIDDPHLADGLNVYAGGIAHAAVARDVGAPLKRPDWLPFRGA